MAMRNWLTPSSLSSVVISAANSGKFIPSETYSGLYLYSSTDLTEDPLVLFSNGTLLSKQNINANAALFNSEETHGLVEGQWGWTLNESKLIGLNNTDKSRWTATAQANIWYYNNLDVTADPKVPVKPVKMLRSGKHLREAFEKLTTKTVGGATYPALNMANLPVDGEWVWALDPTDSFMTIYVFNSQDPDASTVNSFKYSNGSISNTIYIKLETDPNNVEITKPGEIVRILPEVPSGQRVLVTGIVLYNGDETQSSDITLEISDATGSVKVPFYSETLKSTKSYFIDSTLAINAGQHIKIYSDNKKVTAVVTGDIA